MSGAHKPTPVRPTREETEDAVRTLIAYAGDDPTRAGVLETPRRVSKAFAELFGGYSVDPVKVLQKTFEEAEGYDEMVALRDIRLESYCEHHMLPIIGKAHVAYLPDRRVVGISKLARVVEIYARRFQIQEKLTAQIAEAIQSTLAPRGVAVVIQAEHMCMTVRGVHKTGVTMVTSQMLGDFRSNGDLRREFLSLIHCSGTDYEY